MTIKNCIVSQVHIPPFDNQGLTYDYQKVKMVELSIKSLRTNNFDDYIVMIGHGLRPNVKILDLCDYVYWEDVYNPIAGTAKMPAQYTYVSKGIKHCVDKGYTRILKVRGDSIYDIKNIVQYFETILIKENTKLFITQMTATLDYKMGDCVMYGDSELLDYIWDSKHPIKANDGLIQTGKNFVEYFIKKQTPIFNVKQKLYNNLTWIQMLKKYCSFRNINTIRWMDLRFNYHILKKIGLDILENKILKNEFDVLNFYWGKTNNWFNFDLENNKLNSSIESYYLEESTFYENI